MKLKNLSAFKKRIKVTKSGKFKRRHTNQDHFNSRESGSKTRSKRGKVSIPKIYEKAAQKLLPSR